MRRHERHRRRPSAVAVVLTTATALMAPLTLSAQAASSAAPAAPTQKPNPSAPGADRHPAEVPARDRAEVVGGASDRAWTTSGDASGFHVLVAEAKEGYLWKTAATLSEPGFDTDAWIGNACVTASGDRAVVAYAPRTFTNKPELMTRGAFTAVVELATGKVTKLPVQASLSYFSPGCGEGETAVLSQFTDDESKENATRLITVDAKAGRTAAPLKLTGQVTSAIPYGGGEIVAADGARLVRIGKDGGRRAIARTDQVPFRITRDAAGGITFLDAPVEAGKGSKASGQVKHVDAAAVRSAGNGAAKPRLVASGRLTALDVAGSPSGEVYVTGEADSDGTLPAHVHNPGGLDKDAVLSARGQSAVSTRWAHGKDGSPIRPEQATTERTVVNHVTVLGTGKDVELEATPGAEPLAPARRADGLATSPALHRAGAPAAAAPSARTTQKASLAAPAASGASAPAASGASALAASASASASTSGAALAAAASPNDPAEAERTCAVPRGDVRKQAFQPTPRQIEWAVDQAVIMALNQRVNRVSDWKSMGMAAYSPQALFPLRVLSGDPNGYIDKADDWHIPAQIMLGVITQESNMWQAGRYVVPGATGNPLIGNYYGIEYAPDGTQGDPWLVNWSKADCGYGLTQITDGMRLPGHDQPTLSPAQQEAAALDYTANIAAGVDKLAEKWNETRDAGLIINNGKPRFIENWIYALWAYNAGFHPQADAAKNNGAWGVGWINNPANPLWKANRPPFLEAVNGDNDYSAASHPQDWPYQEKVMGWAARPISAMLKPGTMGAGFIQAWWNSNAYRTMGLKPWESLFCDAENECDRTKIGPDDKNEPGLGACTRADLHCWQHHAVTYRNCDNGECGYPVHRFDTTYPEQPDENDSYRPRCNADLPEGSLVVDDVPDNVSPTGWAARGCGTVKSAGTFAFDFNLWNGTYPGKIDMHQVGGGYLNHFWFSHTRDTAGNDGGRLLTTGTWTLNRNIGGSGWARVMVHIPDHGAHTRQARYVVHGTDSTSPVRVVPQRTQENRWVDLGAFHFTGTPKVSLSTHADGGNGSEDVAWDAVAFQPLPGKPGESIVALGDSYSSGEGASVSGGSDYYRETNYQDRSNGATRDACHRSKLAWSRQATLPGRGSSIGALADAHDPSLDYHLIACSGARTYNVLGKSDGGGKSEYGEMAQLDQGYLDQNTTLVTISVGGNDALFTPIFQQCLYHLPLCPGAEIDDVDANGNKTGKSSGTLSDYAPARIHNLVRPQIVKTLKAIKARAPQARIVLMGYPPLMEYNGNCLPGIDDSEGSWLNSIGDVLLQEMDGAAQDARAEGVRVWFSNPKEAFKGQAICGSPETVHGIVTDLVESDGLLVDADVLKFGVSAQSFHPKIAGARHYADSLEQTLSGMPLS
ncbi:NocE [Streptomyces sp. NPDC046203]|uniref:golvesin C-terminal-like domain-containing protein n=1 Tax=Streptomyces sp. NPDC046203 TaxID=3154602 RepID=UPI0033C8C98E